MDTHRRIFLSAASAEYKALRGKLDAILRRSGFECEFQEIFPQTDSDTVRKLGDLIKNCALVLHIVGHLPGSIAEPKAVVDLLKNIPADQFLAHHPELRSALGDFSGSTYTQWEAFLALHYNIPLFVYAPADALSGGKPLATFAQKTHLDRLLLVRKYPESCDGDVEFLSKLPSDVYRRFGIQPPGEKPRSLPYPTLGTLFKGRAPFLASLKKQLATAHPTVIRGAQAIHGMGGVGKTRAAVEYAWQHEADYTALLFLNADSPESLARNLAALTGPRALNLPEQAATDIRVQTQAVRAWLHQHPGWFLIIDNVDTPDAQNSVTELLAQLPDGQIVITSRLADWAAGVTALDLDVLSEKSSIEFLIERTDGRRIARPADDTAAATIAKNLDYLALALEQSAAYIRTRRCTFGDYLRDWETKRPHVMATHDPAKSHYPRSIAITFDTSIALLTEDARQLFRILAWVAPEPMPVVHLENLRIPSATSVVGKTNAHPVQPGGLADRSRGLSEERATPPDQAPQAIHPGRGDGDDAHPSTPGTIPPPHPGCGLIAGGPGVSLVPRSTPGYAPAALRADTAESAPDPRALLIQLADLHLANLSADGTTFAIHRLLQEVARQQQLAQKPQALIVALQWINGQMPTDTDDVRTWPVAIPLVPHALRTATFAADRDIPEPTARLLNQAAMLLQTQANYPAAEPHYRRALAIGEANFGNDHPNFAMRLNNLAMLLKDTNRLAEAEPLMRRALAIWEVSLGEKHSQVAAGLNNLATLLHDTNRLAAAEPLMRQALAIDEVSFGKDHPYVARSLNNLAQLLHDTDRLAEAEPLMHRALAIDEASFGNDHPEVAIRLNNLALLLRDTNRLAEAEPLMRRALAIAEASFGNDHPSVATSLNNLALLLHNTNRLAEAETLMKDGVRIVENSLGPEHPNSVIARKNLQRLQDEIRAARNP